MKKIIFAFLLFFSFSFALTQEEIKRAYYQSYLFENKGDYQKAIESLMIVYTHYPNGYTINLRLGWLYYLNRNYANSIYHYDKAIKVAPYSLEAKLGLTLPYLAQERYSIVEKICYQILKVDYYNYYGNLRLAYSLRKERKYKLAIAVISKMLSIYPTDTKFLLELALNYIKINRKKDAKKILEDILILEPYNSKAKYYLEKLK